MIITTFKVNSLVSRYAEAIYQDIKARNGGDYFTMNVGNKVIEVAISDGAKSVRLLVDSYLLNALKQEKKAWKKAAVQVLKVCVINGVITGYGREIWKSMINDMGNTLAEQGEFQ
ncbi:hypothetical protein C9446_13540 [Providencia heimbachae]|uniref:hypothetical protein n=1 Tax=Providencia heimbachae TaxID=333962 RepID=UPI0010BEF074|nr:hypothetical protein C9446_13540 [Providencia heimbachae]